MVRGYVKSQKQGERLSDESEKATIGRRSLILAGTALPVLSISGFGSQLQQAQAQTRTPSTAPAAGKVVMVASSDTTAAIQTKLNSIPAGGRLVFPGGSTFNLGRTAIVGKDGVTVWADGVVTLSGGASTGNGGVTAFNFNGRASGVVRGKAPGQGFVFNGNMVDFGSANGTAPSPWAVGNCVFNNQPSNGLNGCAVNCSGASFGLIINNDFNNCKGNVLGQYDWDNITVDGNHFTNPLRPISLSNGIDRRRGRNIKIMRNVITGANTGIEFAGEDVNGVGEYTANLLIDNNWLVDHGSPIVDGTDYISLVMRGAVGTVISNNYFRGGGIEFDSRAAPATVTGNLFDTDGGLALYDLGANIAGNSFWNTSYVPPPGNTMLTSAPVAPPQPVRVVW